jgi:hypothetical protein
MDNHYQEKHEELIRNIKNLMFTFEVTKCCGYSTFIPVYKYQTLLDLYSNIIEHFGNIKITELFFISPQNERIIIPMSKQTVYEFVSSNILHNPIKLVPIYPLPKPIIYRLYIYDQHCNPDYCSNVHYQNR